MALQDPVYLYAVGTAGSGKSKFTAGFQRWCDEHALDAIAVNLDPGAEALPYRADVDVRDYIRLDAVMDQYQLGPNGAQVMAADLIALRSGEIKQEIEQFRPRFVLIDTPGQMELFVFRESGRFVMETLGRDRAFLAFLMDPFLAKRASAFVSQMMLSATTQFRFQVPVRNILTKTDLLKDEERDRLLSWSGEMDKLLAAVDEERADMYTQLNTDLGRVLDGFGVMPHLVPTSAETLEGLDDVYADVMNVFAGGEDEDPQ